MTPYPLQSILFLDIETAPASPQFTALGEEWQHLWIKKSEALLRSREGETAESIYSRAGIYAEFGKIICISCGFIQETGQVRKIIIKSFADDDESVLLKAFSEMLTKWTANDTRHLCAHNGKEFDFPFICRRLIINNLTVPPLLNVSGKKPWEVTHLDTMELWKFGDFKSYTSLNLLARSLGIDTPKDDIDGSMVWQVYWEEKNLSRIVTYCQKDVVTVAQIFLRIHGEPCIASKHIEIK